jgi:hypothetical protein
MLPYLQCDDRGEIYREYDHRASVVVPTLWHPGWFFRCLPSTAVTFYFSLLRLTIFSDQDQVICACGERFLGDHEGIEIKLS